MPTRASTADLLRLRLAAQSLAPADEPSPEAVVDRMLAVQAQDFQAACWALGVRAAGITLDDVTAALDAGRIVRSWPMRGTLHFVPARDLGWMLKLTTARMIAGLARRHTQLELDDHSFDAARDVVVGALSGGATLGRAELLDLWESRGIRTTGQRGYHLIYYFAQTGLICWGPSYKGQQSLVLLDEWVPDPRLLEGDEAWAEFVFRYLDGHGPATVKDFVWWTKGTVASTTTGLAVLGDRVRQVEVDGTSYWMTAELADRAGPAPRRRPTVQILPGFDEYVLGYQNRDLALAPEFFERIVPGGNGIFKSVIVSGGRVAGTWTRSTGSKRVRVEAQPFVSLSQAERAGFAKGVRAYARFLGLPGEVA